MQHILDISFLITHYGYLGIFIVVFLESGIFFALPGDSLLFTAGILASAGLLSMKLIIFYTFVATFLGSVAGYWIGFHLKKLEKYAFFRKIIKQENLDKAHQFFEKYGKFTMSVSRFVPIVRTFVPIVAGISKTDYLFFIKWNLLGSIIWTIVVTSLGFYFGKLIPNALSYTHYFIIGVVAVSLIPIFWKILQKKSKEKIK